MNREEIQSLLLELVNGSISPDQRKQVEEALEQDENLRQERDLLEAWRDSIKNEEITSPGDWGWARLQRDIQTKDETEVETLEDQPLPEKNQTHLNKSQSWRYLALAASFFLVLQTSYLILDEADDYSKQTYQTLSGNSGQERLDVIFKSGLSEIELREELIRLNGRIIDGPSSLGIYQIIFENNEAAKAELTLRGRVDYAEVVQP